jgi:hypothetical protein
MEQAAKEKPGSVQQRFDNLLGGNIFGSSARYGQMVDKLKSLSGDAFSKLRDLTTLESLKGFVLPK